MGSEALMRTVTLVVASSEDLDRLTDRITTALADVEIDVLFAVSEPGATPEAHRLGYAADEDPNA